MSMTPEQLFEKYYDTAEATAYKMLGSVKGVAKRNGIDPDDIFQVAREALWESCLAWDETKGNKTFKNFAIGLIRWKISQRTKQLSRHMDKRGRIPKDDPVKNHTILVSMDKNLDNDEDNNTYHDMVKSNADVESEVFNSDLATYLKQHLSEDIFDMIKMKSEKSTLAEIGKKHGLSGERVRQKILKAKNLLESVNWEVATY